MMTSRVVGIVKGFNNKKGYGFIERVGGEDVFVHYCQIMVGGFRALRVGQREEYSVTRGSAGLKAVDVRLVEE